MLSQKRDKPIFYTVWDFSGEVQTFSLRHEKQLKFHEEELLLTASHSHVYKNKGTD